MTNDSGGLLAKKALKHCHICRNVLTAAAACAFLIEAIPKLNFDAVIELSYYLAFKAKLNDKFIWRAVEGAILENFHLYDLRHTCQLQWSLNQLKPRHTTTRLSTML
mgnify:CR=1 FL=1